MTLQFALCNLHFEMLYSRRKATAPDKVFTLRFACPSGNRLRRLREYKTKSTSKNRPSRRALLLACLSYAVIHLLGMFTKRIYRNRRLYRALRERGEPPLLAFWHGRQFFGYYPHRGHGLVIPASLSEDGDIVEMVLGRMGHTIVRGSSSRGAVRLVLDMIREVKKGKGLALSVDGPRGPYRVVKPGIIKVAQKTGRPIVPMVCSASRMWICRNSWDNYMIPKPFSTVLIRYMEPIYVPPDADRGTIEAHRRRLQEALERGYREVDAYFGFPDLEEKLKKGR